jgi:hypothetical protein
MTLSYDVRVDVDLDFVSKSVEVLEGEFGNSVGGPKWTDELLLWKLSDVNPSGKGILVIAEIDGKIIATASLTMKRMILDGKEVLGGEIGDTYSAEKFRRLAAPKALIETNQDASHYVNKSLFGRLVSEIINHSPTLQCEIIYGTPNANSLPGYVKKLQFFKIRGYKNVSRSRPTSLFIKVKAPLPRIILEVVIPVISKLSYLYRSLILLLFRPKKLIVKSLLALDEDIDALWQDCSPSQGFSLIRDSKYYNYRYRNHPFEKYNHHAFYIDGKLACMLTTCIKTDSNGNNVVVICDYLKNKKISFLYLLNYIVDSHAHLPVLKYNFWCEEYGQDFMSAIFSGFIGGSSAPIIFFESKKTSVLAAPSIKMDFHIGSSDNI